MTVCALHGFTGTGADFDTLAASVHQTVWAPDLVGHGGEIPLAPGPLVDAISARFDSPVHLVGYSMGGRLALSAALHSPASFRSVALISASPGIRNAQDQAQRRKDDEARALRLESIGVSAFMDEWEQHPIIRSQTKIAPAIRKQMQRRRRAHSAKDLAHSLRTFGTGSMSPMWDGLAQLGLPVLLITGADDHKFTQIAAEMAEIIPIADHVEIPATGHCTHLEAPILVAEALSAHWNMF